MSAFNLQIFPSVMAQRWLQIVALLSLFSLFSWPSQLWFSAVVWWLTAALVVTLLALRYSIGFRQPSRLLLCCENANQIKILVDQRWLSFQLCRRCFVNDYCCLLWLQAQSKQQRPQAYRLWLFRDSMSQSSYRCLARTIVRLRHQD